MTHIKSILIFTFTRDTVLGSPWMLINNTDKEVSDWWRYN